MVPLDVDGSGHALGDFFVSQNHETKNIFCPNLGRAGQEVL